MEAFKFCCAISCSGFIALSACASASRHADLAAAPLNVLFILVDDLRPELGCYGTDYAVTPRIDRFADTGTVFNRAYVAVAVCAPSRDSLLTGLRPAKTGCYNIPDGPHWQRNPAHVALPRLFKENGYTVSGYGKIAHNKASVDMRSWTRFEYLRRPRFTDPKRQAAMDRSLAAGQAAGLKDEALWESLDRPSVESADVPDTAYGDGQIAEAVVGELEGFAKTKEPFFLMVGLRKPHLPFCAPKKCWDLYDREKVPLSPVPGFGKNMPHRDRQGGAHGEMRQYRDQREELAQMAEANRSQYPEALARELRHGYLACASYVDSNVGKMLDALEAGGLTENTVVVLCGDHGWLLGDLSIWGKHNTFEFATRAPLVVRVPGQKRAGAKTDALVELLDIYPSLADACGLPISGNLEGKSFIPLLDDPSKDWKSGVLSEYVGKKINGVRAHSQSLRTDRYRYTEHRDALHPETLLAVELFDHQKGSYETVNVADDHSNVVARLAKQLDTLMGRSDK